MYVQNFNKWDIWIWQTIALIGEWKCNYQPFLGNSGRPTDHWANLPTNQQTNGHGGSCFCYARCKMAWTATSCQMKLSSGDTINSTYQESESIIKSIKENSNEWSIFFFSFHSLISFSLALHKSVQPCPLEPQLWTAMYVHMFAYILLDRL